MSARLARAAGGFHAGFVLPDGIASPLARAIADGLDGLGGVCHAVGVRADTHAGPPFHWENALAPADVDLFFIDWSREDLWQDAAHRFAHQATELVSANKVYLSGAGHSYQQSFPADAPAFVAHGNRHITCGGWRFPVPIGLDRASLAATQALPPFAARARMVLRPWGHEPKQTLRALAELALLPRLEGRIALARRENNEAALPSAPGLPGWAEAMAQAQICLGFGGKLLSDWWSNPGFRHHAPRRSFLLSRDVAIAGWDSPWLWRSLAAECLTIACHFEKEGFELPEMPVDGVHYLALDLSDMRRSVERILDLSAAWGVIAAQGRAFALAHYAPEVTAKRLLRQVVAARAAQRGRDQGESAPP